MQAIPSPPPPPIYISVVILHTKEQGGWRTRKRITPRWPFPQLAEKGVTPSRGLHDAASHIWGVVHTRMVLTETGMERFANGRIASGMCGAASGWRHRPRPAAPKRDGRVGSTARCSDRYRTTCRRPSRHPAALRGGAAGGRLVRWRGGGGCSFWGAPRPEAGHMDKH
jgi:hypothetical protein